MIIQRAWRRTAAATISVLALVLLPGASAPTNSVGTGGSSTSSSVQGLNDAEARRVRREGRVVRPFNFQAPSFYALEARDSGKIINFLMTTRAEPLNWRQYRGKIVVVTGREYLDHRKSWRDVPLLNVDTIEAVR